jgi:hypothetical protein
MTQASQPAPLDAKRFIRVKFGSPARLVSVVKAWGAEPPKVSAALKWYTRNSIPGEWLPVLLAVLELENGEPQSMTEFVSLSGR